MVEVTGGTKRKGHTSGAISVQTRRSKGDYVTGGLSTKHFDCYTTGVKNPRWKQQIATGQQAGTNFEGADFKLLEQQEVSLTSVQMEPHTSTGAYDIVKNHTNGFYPIYRNFSNVDPISLAKANTEALTAVTQKAYNMMTRLQGGVIIGELRETLRLLRNPAKALRRGIDSYRDTCYKRARRVSRHKIDEVLADTWLEYMFGWAPLINDIKAAIEVLDSAPRSKWVSVRGVGTDRSVSTIGGRSFGNIPLVKYDEVIESIGQVRYIACIGVNISSVDGVRDVGFAPSNFLPTVWELIPYSFVVDYFTNIGAIISAFSLPSSNIRWVLKTERRIVRVTNVRKNVSWANKAHWSSGVANSGSPGALKYEFTKVNRSPYTGSLVPDLAIHMPGTGTKWLNLAALARVNPNARAYFSRL